MKQNLHAIADTKYQYFQTCGWYRFTCRTQHALNNYCIWIMHKEPGVGHVISEIQQKKVEKNNRTEQ